MNILIFIFVLDFGFVLSADILLSQNKFTNSSPAYYFASQNVTWDSSRAVDGNGNGNIYNGYSFDDKWWLVILDDVYVVTKIKIYARTDCCTSRLSTLSFFASYDPIRQVTTGPSSLYKFQYYQGPPPSGVFVVSFNVTRLVARTIMVTQRVSNTAIELCELEVYGHRYYQPNPVIYTSKPAIYANATAIQTIQATSVVKCSKICKETFNCVSFTFLSNGTCETFSHAGGTYSMVPD